MQQIGMIGLGVLGSALVPFMLEAGYPVVGFDVDTGKMKEFADQGMKAGGSPQDVAERADIIFTCLPTAESLFEVIGGVEGIDKSAGKDQIIVELSTFGITDKEKARAILEADGKLMLDCPLSGNRIMAKEKKLTAFLSGDEELCKKVEPIIACFTGKYHYVGDFGNGMKMKFCNNILNLVHNSVAAEVMVLGMKAGLDPKTIHEVISGSGASSRMFEVRGKLMAENDYKKEGMNFSIPLKDCKLITAHAAENCVPLPIYQAALQPYYSAIAHGHHDEDQSAVCTAMELAANVKRE